MQVLRALAASAAFSLISISTAFSGDDSRFTQITDDWQDPVYRQYDFWTGVRQVNWVSLVPGEFFYPDQGALHSQWMYPTLNGKALLEFTIGDAPYDEQGNYTYGFSVRYYDTAKERWVMAQEWPGGPNSTTAVLDQLQGFYRFGRLKVLSTYWIPNSDPPVERTRRYTFTDIRPEGYIWHWMNTADQGNTWTEASMAENSRLEPEAEWPAAGEPMPNYDDGKNCSDEKFKAFDDLAGEWQGTVVKDGEQKPAVLTGYLMIGGCGVMNYIEFENDGEDYTLLEVRSIFRAKPEWWVYQLDSRHGTPHTYQAGTIDGNLFTFFENKHFVIPGEFINHSLSKLKRDDANALKKTVWTALNENELAFEWWVREAPNADWEKEAEFNFAR